MNPDQALSILTALALLRIFGEGKRFSRALLRDEIKVALRLFLATGFLLLIHAAIFKWGRPIAFFRPPLSLYIYPAAFLAARIQNRGEVFFISAASFTIFIGRSISSPRSEMIAAALLVFAQSVMYVLFVGLKERLLLSSAPRPAAGLPIFLVTAGLLVLAVAALMPR